MSESKFVTVYRSYGMLAAQVVKGKLETAGIPTILKYESAGQVLGLTVDGLGEVEVQVLAPFADEATALVTEDSDETALDADEFEEPADSADA